MTTTFGVDCVPPNDGWKLIDNHHYEKVWEFPDFVTALDFVNRASALCEEQNHHAEFVLSWGRVLIRTWSHDIDGLSKRDWDLIEEIDRLV